MPVFVNWLLRLLPTNPICMRLVQGGSTRMRHMYIRSGYLALMMVVLMFVLISETNAGGNDISLRSLAAGGARMFQWVSYLQVSLICLLTPVFMAGAIAQEANPQTWDILLTTPLNNLQVVLGNLFGRLFFVLALLISSLPLFAVTQYFGGVPGDSIFASYAIAGTCALLVAAIAVTLSVTRTAGRRAVFVFYISVIMYLFVTYALDQGLREPVAIAANTHHTTVVTPLNPFLALEVLLQSNAYAPRDPVDYVGANWLTKLWMTRPISAFCWLCAWSSLLLVAFSTVRLRVIGAKVGTAPWYRKLLGLGAKGASERPPRPVGRNPVAWREASARGKTFVALAARWGFVLLGVVVAIVLITLHRTGMWTAAELQLAVTAVVSAELVIITLAALNMSATAVSREREDGSLDIILTTPIQPGPYLTGKLKGLIQFLLPMILVPTITLLLLMGYVMADGLGAKQGVMVRTPLDTGSIDLPVVLPEGALALPLMFVPFVAFCVMIGLYYSIRSRGTISSVVFAVFLVIVVVGVLSLCGMATGGSMDVVGSVITTFSPINLLFALVHPGTTIPSALRNPAAGRISLVVGAAIAAVGYAFVVYALHSHNKRTFMMTVRRLAGQN